MEEGASTVCANFVDVLYLVGIVMTVLKIAVPIILIVVGMVELLKAISSQDDSVIKKAQSGLVKKLVIGIVIFLIPTLIKILFGLVGGSAWEACTECLDNPFDKASCAQTLTSD